MSRGRTYFHSKSTCLHSKFVLSLVLYVLLLYFMYSALYSAVSREFESIHVLEIQSEYRQSTHMYSTGI